MWKNTVDSGNLHTFERDTQNIAIMSFRKLRSMIKLTSYLIKLFLCQTPNSFFFAFSLLNMHQ